MNMKAIAKIRWRGLANNKWYLNLATLSCRKIAGHLFRIKSPKGGNYGKLTGGICFIGNYALTYEDLEVTFTGLVMKVYVLIFLSFSLLLMQERTTFPLPNDSNECTIGVFSGRVTADGRPLLWKNRDIGEAVQKMFKPVWQHLGVRCDTQ